MSKAKQLIESGTHDVVWVCENGTSDAAQAIYVDGKLVTSDPRGETWALLRALGIKPREMFVANGFEYPFPPKLSVLKTV